ncbi:MAG TPA: hypothetical protein VM533_15780 [Fimbriiglobus sp.]|nr:hypothetical protein [Fimbriiglobus sp.]
MATDTAPRRADVRQRTTLGNRFRFLVRVLGMTGLLAAPVGFVLAGDALPAAPTDWTSAAELSTLRDQLVSLCKGESGTQAQAGAIALVAGAAAVLLWFVVELLGGLFLATGRKTVVGTNTALQVALAAALLVIVNAVSFGTHWRFDLTRDQQFTFPQQLIDELRTLRADSPTTIVVLHLHATAGSLSDKSDPYGKAYGKAAERKVIEKVNDLVDQLREFGPRFNVVVLDAEDDRFERQVRELTRTRPGLAEAVRTAPEDSIFFYADEKVRRVPRTEADRLADGPSRPATAADPDDAARALVYPGAITRMSFSDFYQLDMTSSKEPTAQEREEIAAVAGGAAFAPGVRGSGNLVLLPRGKEAFVKKVLALEERKPRVALAVIHPALTSREENDMITAAGLRSTLEANGFEVVDLILKKGWNRRGEPTAAAYTYEESELDRAEARYNLLTLLVADREAAVRLLTDARAGAEKALAAAGAAATDAEKAGHLAEAVRALQRVVRGRITTEDQVRAVAASLGEPIDAFGQELADYTRKATEAGDRYRDLLRNERAVENRRVTDVREKFGQTVADCDLLIVPRLTVLNLARGQVIPPSLFDLSKEQAEVVKEFIKGGKPVLFALGPTNVDQRGPAGDDVERLLPQLGIIPGGQTVITDAEAQSMAEGQNEGLSGAVVVPPVVFDTPRKDGQGPNPVAEAFRVTSRAVDRKLDLRGSGFRPIYVAPAAASRLPYAAEIMHAGKEYWNESRPVPEDDTVPKFDPARPDDPKKGTRDEERRGPFPVGVAVETPVPADWFEPTSLPSHAQPTAAAVGVAAAYPNAPRGLAAGYPAAALALRLDGGLLAAGLTLAAQKVERPTVRVVALGHGGLFTGSQLDPAQQTLLLHTLNWQLHRDDRLPADVPDDKKWRYPRADLSGREFFAWRWLTFAGLPLLTAYVGLIALMVRKVR